jgi:DNA primase catalytic core
MYKESSVQAVREADIVSIISHYCPDLKRAGSMYECRSPFSEDKTASFKVSPAKNNFVCYSSQQKGDGIKFVKIKERCEFLEAVRIIAGITGIVLEEEKQTEDQIRIKANKEQMHLLIANVAREYQKQFNQLPATHWAKKMVADRQINEETLINFSIGYAPEGWQFVTGPIIDNGRFEVGKSIGLINVKDGKSFDFFRNRVMFPLEDVNGNVVAFGGRCADDDPAKEQGRKYINSKESDIYIKSKVLYGLYQAKHSIAKAKTAVLVEGYTDVTALHQHGCDIAVASGGTALTTDQAKLLMRFASHVIICRDNDGLDAQGNEKGGVKAALRDIDILLAQGFKVSVVILPEGEDPDSYSRKIDNITDYIINNAEDAVQWKTMKLYNKAANDPDALSEAVTEVSKMLFCIKDDIKRNAYTDTCRKLLKQPAKFFKEKIEQLAKDAESKAEKKGVVDAGVADELGLPEGADFKEFMQNRFVTVANACWFRGRDGFFKGTNYKIEPLFHVYGKSDNKRLCEVINEHGYKKLIDFNTADFVSRQKFEEVLLNEGFFIQFENFGANHFTLMKNTILANFIMAYELKTLGWQKEGFFAYSNFIYHKGLLKEVNNYGIVQLETGIKNDSEYQEDVKHFYSPSCSEMYKHMRDDDDPYENDRYFVYKKAPITLQTWMKQLKIVYKDKAMLGILSIFFSLNRDLFVRTHAVSPLLFLSGEKGSGKSKYAESLASLFSFKQPSFDLNSSTLSAFSRRIARTRNTMSIMEEFHDNIEFKILQSIKGSYDNRGRELGTPTGDNRGKTVKVNTFLVLLSQYLSSWDDNAITTRSIIQHFIKPQEQFTQEEIDQYNLLKSWEEEGLTSLLIDILQHREKVEENYIKFYASIIKKLKNDLKLYEYQERMLQNYVVIMTPISILWDDFHFPFTYEEMYKTCKEAIIDSSDLIVESEGLSEFWRTLEYLLDRKPYPLLVDGIHFKIDTPQTLLLQSRKGEKDHVWNNSDREQILMLRLNAVHQLYHKEVSTREGAELIGENTLRNYFKSKKYFIGAVKSHRFDDTSTSAYIFNYTMMHEGGVLNLVRKEISEEEKEEEKRLEKLKNSVTSSTDKPKDDLPF